MKYFCKETPEYHIAAAGSLLGVAINRQHYSFPLVQNEILDNYIADMAKYANNTESVKIRACYNSIPAQLAKENKKFQYKVVQKGGSASVFGASIEWLNLAGVVLKCSSISQATEPIAVYTDLSAFKLYMGDVGLLTMGSHILGHPRNQLNCSNYTASKSWRSKQKLPWKLLGAWQEGRP